MADANREPDPFNLERFLIVQNGCTPSLGTYSAAIDEISNGCKRTHWMWYIFPQMKELGHSEMAVRYGITSAGEARAYLDHPVLGTRLRACAQAVMNANNRSAHDIFGSPDDLKLLSSMTLFSTIEPPGSVFHQIIDKCFGGNADGRTMEILEKDSQP